MWTPAEVEFIKWTVIGVLALAVAAAILGGWLYFRVVDRDQGDPFGDDNYQHYYYDDDYFSDIQDAIKDEEEGQVEGQQKLWETGQMPVVGGGDSIPPQHRAEYAALLAAPVPQLEPGETATPAPEAVSVAPEPAWTVAGEHGELEPGDELDSTFIRNFKADLDAWVAEQEAIRQAWRKENGLDCE